MPRSDVDPTYLQKRLDVICEGLKEAVRREVQRLRDLGLPVFVADNGRVVSRPYPSSHPRSAPDRERPVHDDDAGGGHDKGDRDEDGRHGDDDDDGEDF